MSSELKSLRIDKSKRAQGGASGWATRWILIGVGLLLFVGAARFANEKFNSVPEVTVMRVASASSGSAGGGEPVVLNATGYIVAAHKIQVASRVLGRVAWIGVDKGDKVKQGQVLARLEDDEYRASLQQAKGQLQALQARLAELEAGSRPEEIAKSNADLQEARADLANSRINLDRNRSLSEQGIVAKQTLDDAKARFERETARVSSIEKTFELTKIGPRKEQIDAVRGQIVEAQGRVDFYQTQLENTVIRAPVTGTILEREVEKGEFVTTSFVGENGAKGYVVSLADLNDLEVELDINQNDFAKLGPKQKGIVNTDAYPDRKYEGFIGEVSPEANRQKATVQVKVKISKPDDFLRPEMNASVAFVSEAKDTQVAGNAAAPVVYVPASAVRNNAVFVLAGDKAVKRTVRTGPVSSQGIRIEQGLNGGEDLVVNPSETLQDGDRIKRKQG